MIIHNTRKRAVSITLKSGKALNIVANGEATVKESEITDSVRRLKFLTFSSPQKVKITPVVENVVADIIDDTDLAEKSEN